MEVDYPAVLSKLDGNSKERIGSIYAEVIENVNYL